MVRNLGLKPKFLIDSFQSAFWHLLGSVPWDSGSLPVVGIFP